MTHQLTIMNGYLFQNTEINKIQNWLDINLKLLKLNIYINLIYIPLERQNRTDSISHTVTELEKSNISSVD